mgnify:CR=1 FL=1
MKQVKTDTKVSKNKKPRPALTPEARENQLISLAVDLAEQQLLDGTASSQVITHFLKLASSKEKLEKEKLQNENTLLKTKVEALQSTQRIEELYADAIKAMSLYRGEGSVEDADSDIF